MSARPSALRVALQASVRKITVFLLAVLTIVIIVGAMMYQIEGEANGFTSIPVGMYWAIVTVTTVGYGDISPHTVLGRILASLLMTIGYGIIAVPTGIVTFEYARASACRRLPRLLRVWPGRPTIPDAALLQALRRSTLIWAGFVNGAAGEFSRGSVRWDARLRHSPSEGLFWWKAT